MLFEQPLPAIVEQVTADKGMLRGSYVRLFEEIERRDMVLRSMCDPSWGWIERELARLDALFDAGGCIGLAGVPVGVKDTIAVKGLPTCAGTQVDLGRFLSLQPSPAVAALQQAGAVVVGKQATHQFGSSFGPAPTQSIRGPGCFAGGSSVGGAVAVAAGFTALALCTDGGGSVRKPAALAGVAGLRPRKGSICDDGQANGAVFGQSTGLIARSVDDIAAVLERCPRLLGAPLALYRPSPLVVGIPDIARASIAAEAEHALQSAAIKLRAMGHDVVPTSLLTSDEAAQDFLLAVQFDNWEFHAPLLADHADIYEPAVARVIRRGEIISQDTAASAKRRLADHRARFLEIAVAEGIDVMLTPSVPWPDVQTGMASSQNLSAEAGRFTTLANIFDFDSVSLPVERGGRGVYSVMLTGLAVSLSELLANARRLETRRSTRDRRSAEPCWSS